MRGTPFPSLYLFIAKKIRSIINQAAEPKPYNAPIAIIKNGPTFSGKLTPQHIAIQHIKQGVKIINSSLT